MASSRFAPPRPAVLTLKGVAHDVGVVEVVTNTEVMETGPGWKQRKGTVTDRSGHKHEFPTTGNPDTVEWVSVGCDGVCGDPGCEGVPWLLCSTCGDRVSPPITQTPSRTIPLRRDMTFTLQVPADPALIDTLAERTEFTVDMEGRHFRAIATTVEHTGGMKHAYVKAVVVG